MSEYRLGVDIGGTFTDIVLVRRDGVLFSKKILSTPHDYSEAIEEGVRQLLNETEVAPGEITEFGHGTTVATNTIIERKGVKVALVTTKGFRDVLELGRYRVPRLYDLAWAKPEPLVERRFRFEVPERQNAAGEELVPVDLNAVDDIAEALNVHGINSVAICFLHSYASGAHEAEVARRLNEVSSGLSISASSELMPQIQEYERTSTTVVNAYLRPIIQHYVESLQNRLNAIGVTAPLRIMQSSGAMLPGKTAADRPVYIIESGPAAGVVGAREIADERDLGDVIVFDMGGTTAKASIVAGGAFSMMPETEVGGGAALGGHRLIKGAGYIVQAPTIDIAEVGAGGGSIAHVDAAGGLKVGPESAGASPGPACYDRGGEQPTVTDANLLLGYLNPDRLVGGELTIRRDKSEATVGALGASLGLDLMETAFGIHQLANSNMLRALKSVTIERGFDPSKFTLFAIGGNGGVHGWGMAEALDIRRVVIPPVSGLFSALGLLFVDVQREAVQAYYKPFADIDLDEVNQKVAALKDNVHDMLAADGFDDRSAHRMRLFFGLKYQGQMESLTIEAPMDTMTAAYLSALAEAFGAEHERGFGYRSDKEPLQVVSLKVEGMVVSDEARVPEKVERGDRRRIDVGGVRQVYFGEARGWRDAVLRDRASLVEGPLEGPAVIEEYDCTTVVPPDWTATLDEWNNIILTR